MKKISIILIAVFALCCAGAAYAKLATDPFEQTLKIEKKPMPKLPDYLAHYYYDPEGLYVSDISCYSADIDPAKMITIEKKLMNKSLLGDKQFLFYRGAFLSDNNENIDKICKMLPLVNRTVLYDRFEVLEYDADKYINYIYGVRPKFCVVKDRGKVIWYNEGQPCRDIAITSDGRYMIVTSEQVFYTVTEGKRIINEMYGGQRIYGGGGPKEVRILTDNVIRVAFSKGRTEHWKVRLSEEDVENNLKKLNPKFVPDSEDKLFYANKCLMWSNYGINDPMIAATRYMWNYYESEEEPVYKETNLADITSDVAALRQSALSAVGQTGVKAAQGHQAAGEAGKGFFASLLGRIKTFFAGLFA